MRHCLLEPPPPRLQYPKGFTPLLFGGVLMALTVSEIARILIVLTVFLVAAHVGAYVFGRLRQPPVIGEIVGGLLLGGSVLGLLAPSVSGWLVPSSSATAHLLGAVYQLGTI